MMPALKQPTYIGKKRYWSLNDIREWEAALRGETFTPLPESENRYLTARQVRDRFGGVSDMWLWRRLRSAKPKAV